MVDIMTRLWWPLPRSLGHFSNAAFWCFALDRGIWHGLVVVGCFRPLLLASLIIKASKMILLSIHLGLKVSNLKSKPATSKHKCSRENKCLKHKIKHINPQEWIPNVRVTHTNLTLIKKGLAMVAIVDSATHHRKHFHLDTSGPI